MANVLLLATLVFSEWLAWETRLFGYGALVLVWLLARWQSRSEWQALTLTVEEGELEEARMEQAPNERDLKFREAQAYYLQNNWVAAEQVLLKLLKQDARDVESRLMLATLWRHQQRSAEALRQLDRLERFEAASAWQDEIAAERRALNLSREEEIQMTEDIDRHEDNDDNSDEEDNDDQPRDSTPSEHRAA